MLSTRSLARPLLSAIFVSGGIETLRNPGPRVAKAAPVIPSMVKPLGLPADPDLLVKVNAGVQIGAGLLLAIGKVPRLAALALIGSSIPTTYAGHRFWELDEKESRAQQRTHFLKNLGLIGGLILAAVDTEGAPSVSWRVHRRAHQIRRVADEAGVALTGAGSGGGGHAVAGALRRGRGAAARGVRQSGRAAAHGARHGSTAARGGVRRGADVAATGAQRGRAALSQATQAASEHLPVG